MKFWLMKSEPETYSIDDLRSMKDRTDHWDGVRNYQARNLMRDAMKVGDRVLFYHSNCPVPGVVGLAKVVREGYPDFTAWDPKSNYYDPKSNEENPRWYMVDIQFVSEFDRCVSLKELRTVEELEGMKLLQKGQRLSVQPVEEREFTIVCALGKTIPS